MLIDTHAHLNDERLLPEVENIIKDMPKDNLEAIINVGYDLKSSQISVDLANKYNNIYAAVGIHPHDAQKAERSAYDYFSSVSANKKVVAYGEIGLDFYYDYSPREKQQRVFLEQLELAHSLKLPIIIHLRDAYQLMLDLLKSNKRYLEYGCVLHCYSGSKEMLKEFSKLDIYFSFGGAITFKNAIEKPDVIRQTPLDRLLLETDCPYMTPVPFRGKLNYPKYIDLVAQSVANFTSKTHEEIVQITTKNAKNLFKKLFINEEGQNE